MQTSASRAKYAYTHPSRSSTLRAMTFFPRTRPTLGPARFSRQKMKSAVSAFLPFFSWVVHTREEMRGAALACCAGVVAFVGLVVVASVRPFAISVPTLWTTAMLRSSNDSACPAQAQRVGLDPSWPLQFVHVPKTAGTTIQDVLTHSAYERNVWFAMHDIYFESEQLNCTALVRTASIVRLRCLALLATRPRLTSHAFISCSATKALGIATWCAPTSALFTWCPWCALR